MPLIANCDFNSSRACCTYYHEARTLIVRDLFLDGTYKPTRARCHWPAAVTPLETKFSKKFEHTVANKASLEEVVTSANSFHVNSQR